MMTLGQGLRSNEGAGEPIPCPWPQMIQAGAVPRRGQLTLITAAPGQGKSAVAQALTQRGNDDGDVLPTLYFSADSDASTMFKRAGAMATGYQMQDIDSMVLSGNVDGVAASVANHAAHVRLDFSSSPSDQDVLDNIDAFAEVYGAYPSIIVVDNLSNLHMEGSEGEFGQLADACSFLHDIARDSGAAVIALHHTVGEYEAGDKPIPLSGLRGKVSKIPEIVWTLYRSGEYMHISIPKNRNGVAYADGSHPISIYADLSRMRLG